jgi:predicted MPP superfamily phosphohydrolase
MLGALAVVVPLGVASSRWTPPRLSTWWMTPIYLWLGSSVLLALCVAVIDVVSMAIPLAPATGARIALLAGGAASVWAAVEGRRFRVERVIVPLTKLPPALDGLKIVQLSDIHLGPTTGGRFLDAVVDATNALAPDVVVITGDLVDGTVEHLADAAVPLARLSSTFGTYFVTGNHEYHSGAAAWCAHLATLGIRVLRNERVTLTRDGQSIDVAGTDDSDAAGDADGFREDLASALDGRDHSRVLVLLAHQPKAVRAAAAHGVDLQLSGHTHGGQLWPLGWLLRVGQPAVAGVHRVGETLLYVSRGTGHSGPPMRLATPAEITEVVLHCAAGGAGRAAV